MSTTIIRPKPVRTNQRQGATLRDVASLAGVNVASVSTMLNGSKGNSRIAPGTRERILAAARELDYKANVHAQRLAHGRCENTIGLFALNLDEGVGTQKVLAVQRVLQEHGYFVPLHAYGYAGADTVEAQVALLSELCRQVPRAIVCSTGGLFAEALSELRHFQEKGGMMVAFDRETSLNCDQVVFDRRGAELAVRHLVELGHRQLGMCSHGPWEADSNAGLFRSTLEGCGIPWRSEWMFTGGNYEEGGARLAQWWLQLPESDRPTALFIINDRSAMAFTTQVQRAGIRVPWDVSVVGFDNALVASFAPVPLTTISHPAQVIGHHAAQLVLDRLQGGYDGPPRRVVVPSELVRRESTAAPATF